MPAALSHGTLLSASGVRPANGSRPSPWEGPAAASLPSNTSDGQPAAHPAPRWVLRRNCSLTPRQFMGAALGAMALSLGIGVGLFLAGATFILPFSLVEVLALAAALWLHARHATDREIIAVVGDRLVVETHDGPRQRTTELPLHWLRIEPRSHQRALVVLSALGCSVEVGRHVAPAWRQVLAQELRQVLQSHRQPLAPTSARETRP
nr:DUF2244 domain-containing protein [Aquabacterium lacunae]